MIIPGGRVPVHGSSCFSERACTGRWRTWFFYLKVFVNFFLRNENTGIRRKYWDFSEARIVVFNTLYCRVCGAETANSRGSEKREISFVKEREREREGRREIKRKLGKLQCGAMMRRTEIITNITILPFP